MRRALWLMAVVLVAATAATAIDSKDGRETLRGLKGVYVLVEHLNPEAERDGLDKTTIQTDVELKLRQAGIQVLTGTEWLAEPGAPCLLVQAGTLPPNGGALCPLCLIPPRGTATGRTP